MDWDKLDWATLDRLRDGFLSGSAANGPYWRSLEDLAHYDLTFGQRIGWKWDAVLGELIQRQWHPCTIDAVALVSPTAGNREAERSEDPGQTAPAGGGSHRPTVLDWGCGSGVAGRRFISAFGADKFQELLVWDHSALARQFALEAARRDIPKLKVAEFRPADRFDFLLVSHVLNELSPDSRKELLGLAHRANGIIWVEPGTHAVSRDLIGVRETLRREFRVIAPCTHSEVCGLLTGANAPHWCHYFAPPPSAIYADSDWVKFGQRAGIDLRSLPYSFLVLEKAAAEPADPNVARIVGEPRHYKGYAKLLSCGPTGVEDLTLQKRDDPALFKALKRESGVPVYCWSRDKDRIKRATQVFRNPTEPT